MILKLQLSGSVTPMKLSVQHLERSLDPNDDNFKAHLQKFSKKIIQQIDTLTSIANEFSRFAKMPKHELKKLDLKELLLSTIDFFKSKENTSFEFKDNNITTAFIEGDLDQLIRVFNNIINNAIQAIDDSVEGKILVKLSKNDNLFFVSISDNGCGIEDVVKEKIFEPNFTTKTTGTGLGLAMVKQIIDAHNGNIHFKSTVEIGTTFYIEFPITLEDEST